MKGLIVDNIMCAICTNSILVSDYLNAFYLASKPHKRHLWIDSILKIAPGFKILAYGVVFVQQVPYIPLPLSLNEAARSSVCLPSLEFLFILQLIHTLARLPPIHLRLGLPLSYSADIGAPLAHHALWNRESLLQRVSAEQEFSGDVTGEPNPYRSWALAPLLNTASYLSFQMSRPMPWNHGR